MGESLLVRKTGGGAKINGIEESYIANENIQAGDFVSFNFENPSTDLSLSLMQDLSLDISLNGSRHLLKITPTRFLALGASSTDTSKIAYQFVYYNNGVITKGNYGYLPTISKTTQTNGIVAAVIRLYNNNALFITYPTTNGGYTTANYVTQKINDNDTFTHWGDTGETDYTTTNKLPYNIFINKEQNVFVMWANGNSQNLLFRALLITNGGGVVRLNNLTPSGNDVQGFGGAFYGTKNGNYDLYTDVATFTGTANNARTLLGYFNRNPYPGSILFQQSDLGAVTGQTAVHQTKHGAVMLNGWTYGIWYYPYTDQGGIYLRIAALQYGTVFDTGGLTQGYSSNETHFLSLTNNAFQNNFYYLKTPDEKLQIIAHDGTAGRLENIYYKRYLNSTTLKTSSNNSVGQSWMQGFTINSPVYGVGNKLLWIGSNDKVYLIKNNVKVSKISYLNDDNTTRYYNKIDGIALENGTAGNSVKILTL
jgi:hypothetical protein